MKHTTKRTLSFLIPLLVILVFSSQATAAEKSFIWEVKSDTTTVFVHGSIHFAKPEMYPLPKAIENSFAQSENLVVELDPVNMDQQKMKKILMEKGMYAGNKTVRDDLTKEVFQMLSSYLKKNLIPLEKMQKMRPGLLAVTISTAQIMKMGFLPQFGIDMYFALKASQSGKDIIELETMEQQLGLLLNMPDENLFLKFTLKDMEESKKLFNKIITLWQDGDAQGMNELLIEPYENDPELELIIEELFFARNDKMTEKIKGFLKTGQKYFVVVGAGHLIGDKGIINQLKKSGYRVRQL